MDIEIFHVPSDSPLPINIRIFSRAAELYLRSYPVFLTNLMIHKKEKEVNYGCENQEMVLRTELKEFSFQKIRKN